jgi:hypothetical protein
VTGVSNKDRVGLEISVGGTRSRGSYDCGTFDIKSKN